MTTQLTQRQYDLLKLLSEKQPLNTDIFIQRKRAGDELRLTYDSYVSKDMRALSIKGALQILYSGKGSSTRVRVIRPLSDFEVPDTHPVPTTPKKKPVKSKILYAGYNGGKKW